MKQFIKTNLLAVLSLVMAGTTLYLTQFAEPKIDIQVGDVMRVWYGPDKKGVRVLVPVSLLNQSNRVSTVVRLRTVIYRVDAPQRKYVLNSIQFDTLAGTNWQKESDAGALTIPPNGSITKHVRFLWDGAEPLHFLEGGYKIAIVAWKPNPDQAPLHRIYNFFIDRPLLAKIDESALPETPMVTISLGGVSLGSVLLGEEEARRLLQLP